MLNLNATLIAVILNFVVLVWLLNKFLYTPILSVIQERQKGIADSLQAAASANAEAARLKSTFEAQIRGAETQAKALVEEAQNVSDKVRRDAMAQAKQDAETLRHRAQAEADRIKHDALMAVKHDVVVLATDIAAKFISKQLDPKAQSQLMDETLEEINLEKLVGAN